MAVRARQCYGAGEDGLVGCGEGRGIDLGFIGTGLLLIMAGGAFVALLMITGHWNLENEYAGIGLRFANNGPIARDNAAEPAIDRR